MPDPENSEPADRVGYEVAQCRLCIAFRESGEYGFRWCYQHRAEFETRPCSSYHPKRA